ncbi:MAG TPA: 30S ribosome-binding factor RbfA [Candidatus Hydrogenedentes bacterium]|mgnify:FL=1|nr:30S ribosome-binding factor RbfA [Candidatus Hydrogenedentota bacterium]
MNDYSRADRVAALVHEEVARLLQREFKDPRLGFVSVMGVRMSPDMRFANVYVSLYGSDSEKKSSLIALQNGAGWFRRKVGRILRVRHIPEIRFFADDSLDRVYHLEEVLDHVHREQRESPMLVLTLEEAAERFREARSLLITTHVGPDGDAIGSLLGLYWLAKALDKPVQLMVDSPVPQILRFLPGADLIRDAESMPKPFELAVIADCSSFGRVGDAAKWLREGASVLILDHHTEPGEPGTAGHIDSTFAATAELVAELYATLDVPIPPEAALCLYVGQVTDTNGYRFSNTSPRTHRIAARLMEAGQFAPHRVAEQVLEFMPRPKFFLLRRMLDRVEFRGNGAIAASWLDVEDFSDCGAEREHTDNLIHHLRQVEGVRVAALAYAVDASHVKVSLRSDGSFDCAACCRQWGGGGHVPAAGATLEAPVRSALEKVLAAVETSLSADGTRLPS